MKMRDMTLHDQERETSLDKRRGRRPRLTAPGTGPRPHPGRPTPGHRPAPASRPAASGHRHPVQRPARDDQQAHPRHPSAFWSRPDMPSRPARIGWPAWKTSPIWPPSRASSPRRGSRQRVNTLRLLIQVALALGAASPCEIATLRPADGSACRTLRGWLVPRTWRWSRWPTPARRSGLGGGWLPACPD